MPLRPAMTAIKEIIHQYQLIAIHAIRQTITTLQIQITRPRNFQPIVRPVIQILRGLHPHLNMIPSISQYTVENIRVNGPFAPNVTLQRQTMLCSVVLNVMNTAVKLR